MSLTGWSQDIFVSGTVFDKEDAKPGVNIIEKGTSHGVSTDYNGNYEISVSSQDAVLVFSFVGYASKEITVGDRTTINIILQEDTQLLDEVVVNGFASVIGQARKRTESIQVVPESVTALNSEDIEKAGINNVTSFANLVPNLKLSETQAFGINALIIRGIPQIRNTDSPVAFVVDGVTVADPALLNQELFDLALIEVVRGPQGALYGKNSIGGAINIYTKEPTNTSKHNLTFGYGNGNAILGRFISSGAIEKNKIFYRLSTQVKSFDGLLSNEFLNQKVDFKTEFTARGKLTFKMSPKFKINTTVQYLNLDGGAMYYSISPSSVNNDGLWEYLNANPKSGNNIIYNDILGHADMKNFYSNLNLEYRLSNVKLQAITSYSDLKRSSSGDLDFTEVSFLDQGEINNTRSFNQEIRISNRQIDSKFNWNFGGFYQHIERFLFASDALLNDVFAVTNYTATFKTFAVFGFIDYKITDLLTFSAGLRFDSDKFEQDNRLIGETNKKNDEIFQPKASLAHQVSKNTLIFANYGRGYRAGGFNPQVTPLFKIDYEGETSDNYEIGAKSSWWNNRFIANTSIFYSDYNNRQQNTLYGDDFIQGNFNYTKSEIVGFEIETKTRITKELDLLFNYGQVNSSIKKGGTTGGADGTKTDLTQFNGKNTYLVPQNNFNIGLESRIDFGEEYDMDLSVNYYGIGKIYWEDSNNPLYTSDAYQLLDAQVSINKGNWKLTVWAKNILDTQYYLEYYDFGLGWRGTPTTIGSSLSVTF